MAKHGNKHFRHPALISRAHRPPSVIPGLGVDVPELQQARGLWQLNRFDEALVLFEKAVRKYPQNLVALVDASRALGARFEITRAEVMLDRLVKLAAHNPQLMHLAGQSYRMIFRPEKAIQCFERVVAMTKGIPDAQLELAVLYERRHRVAEAYSLIEDCLRAEPDYLEAELFKARLLRRLKDAAGAEAIFRRLAASNEALPLVRAQAWTEIAQKLDREGDYDGAMAAMLQGKQFLMAEEGSFRNGIRSVAAPPAPPGRILDPCPLAAMGRGRESLSAPKDGRAGELSPLRHDPAGAGARQSSRPRQLRRTRSLWPRHFPRPVAHRENASADRRGSGQHSP